MNIQVPNYIPRDFNKIAIIGEAPGRDEEINVRPFVGYSGRFLASLCSSSGFALSNCYLGNVSQYRPPDNKIEAFSWSSDEIEHGLDVLRDDMARLKPNLVVLLGNVPLKAAKDPCTNHPLLPGKFQYSVSNWRGSLFVPDDINSPFYELKCISSYHPAACLRNYEWTPLLRFDLKRASAEATYPGLVLPTRVLDVSNLSATSIVARLTDIRQRRATIAIDIEGGIDTMSCISIATAADNAFIIPFTGHTGSFYTEDDEVLVFRTLAEVLEDPLVPKILQNSLYDLFVLAYSYKILVRGVVDDTMLKHWEAFCELPKGLGFLCSIYTKEPYYKHERKMPDLKTHWTYCCRDSAVTYEINNVLDKHLAHPSSLAHYRFNMDLLSPLLYMEMRGIRYDVAGAAERRNQILNEVYSLNYELDELSLHSADFSSEASLRENVRTIACAKRTGEYKKDYQEHSAFFSSFFERYPNVDKTDKGKFNMVLDLGMNIKSPIFKSYIYDTLELPRQYSQKTKALTTDYEALLTLYKKSNHPALRLAIDIGLRRTREQMLSISADSDGRIRCGYNVVGTETGRLACYTSPTGSGYNLQTIPEYDRDLFLADDGYWAFQCDLSGADTWTVAANLAFLGERTMLEDLYAGLKPAKILALMRRHGASINELSRDALRERSNEVKKSDWDYFACKIGVHGTNYLMGPVTLARNLFLQSEGSVRLSSAEIIELQNLYLLRYRVSKWHQHTSSIISARPEYRAPSGHLRHFFGRREDLLGAVLAHEPQANTTYATNLAAMRLWRDPENRRPNGSLIIEPLHQVHDALVGQFPKDKEAWAVQKICEYFDNPIRIAGLDLVIPFEGAYGVSWGSLKEGRIA